MARPSHTSLAGGRRKQVRKLPQLVLCVALGCALVANCCVCRSFLAPPRGSAASGESSSRRALLASSALLFPSLATQEPAEAFKNRVVKFPGGIKTPGPNPGDLGLAPRGRTTGEGGEDVAELRPCSERPNCFSTTDDPRSFVDSYIKPWKFSGKSPQEAMQDVLEVIKAYEPNQKGIDGGGFQIQEESNELYTYVLFESTKKGYLDDVEFAIVPGTTDLLIRSGSRIGYYDYGVNGLRLNYIAEKLRKKGGWTAPPLDQKSHPTYWEKLCNATDEDGDYFLRNKLKEYCS